MENLLEFGTVVVLISASGVLSPGPLFAGNVFYGLKGGAKAGLKVASGHTIVELPLVILLGIGAFSMVTLPQFREVVTAIGAIGLFAFAGIQMRGVLRKNINVNFRANNKPILAGIVLSGLNPFFIIWWLTIGLKLISDSLVFWSFWGIGIMFGFHIWMDFAWLSSTAFLSSRVSKLLSNKGFKVLYLGLTAALIYFGIIFLVQVFG